MRVSLIICLIFILLSFSIIPASALGQLHRPVELVDKPAPGFSLPDLEGRQIRLSSYKGKNLILFFWTTWCPFCRRSLVELEGKYPSIKAQGIEVLSIDIGEPIYKVKNLLERHPVSFPVLLDSDTDVAEGFRIIGVPTYVLVDSNGNIRLMENSFPKGYGDIFSR